MFYYFRFGASYSLVWELVEDDLLAAGYIERFADGLIVVC